MFNFNLIIGFLFLFIIPAYAKLPCEYLSMVDGNLVVQKGTSICFGNCENIEKANSGIYIARDQELFFANFILSTDPNIDKFTIRHKDGTLILSCYSETNQCFAGSEPAVLPDKTIPGLFLTGQPGGDTTGSVFDPWTVLSTIRLDSFTNLVNVEILNGAQKITGWRISTKNLNAETTYMYTFTDQGQLFVGNEIDAATIFQAIPNTVYAEGPVVVRKGTSGCPVPIPRPNVPSAVLIYSEEGGGGNCNLTADKNSFTITVEKNNCYPSPSGISTTIFYNSYYKISEKEIAFYANPYCTGSSTSFQEFQGTCNQGWSAIHLPVQS